MVDTESIICGALLTQEYHHPDEYFILDAVDDDFWRRMKSVSLAQNMYICNLNDRICFST